MGRNSAMEQTESLCCSGEEKEEEGVQAAGNGRQEARQVCYGMCM